MHVFEVLADPVRRRIVELLATGERAAGDIVRIAGERFAISQPAVSQHLKVLRESGFATVRAEGTRRYYALDRAALDDAIVWIERVRSLRA